MKKVKVSIQDENTLILNEDAQKGDLIDLKSIHETDIDKTTIDNLIKSIKTDEFNAQLEAAKRIIEKEKGLEAELKEKDIINRAKETLTKKDQEITTLSTKLESITKQVESETRVKSLEERQKLEEDYRKKLGDKEFEIQEIKNDY